MRLTRVVDFVCLATTILFTATATNAFVLTRNHPFNLPVRVSSLGISSGENELGSTTSRRRRAKKTLSDRSTQEAVDLIQVCTYYVIRKNFVSMVS